MYTDSIDRGGNGYVEATGCSFTIDTTNIKTISFDVYISGDASIDAYGEVGIKFSIGGKTVSVSNLITGTEGEREGPTPTTRKTVTIDVSSLSGNYTCTSTLWASCRTEEDAEYIWTTGQTVEIISITTT